MSEKDLNFAYLVGAFSIGMLVLMINAGLPLLVNQTYRALDPKEIATTTVRTNFTATHVLTPNPVKGIYVSNSIIGVPSLRKPIIHLIRNTEINTVILDIKDETGRVVFAINNPDLQKFNSQDGLIDDLPQFIETLHKNNIYVIGRIVGFQDPFAVNMQPNIAIRRISNGKVWRDAKGNPWIDPGNSEYANYLILLAKESYALGFDEIQFDGLEFPGTGNIYDALYPSDIGLTKREVVKKIYSNIREQLKQNGIPVSVRVHAKSVIQHNDQNIGQLFEDTFNYFNYVSPTLFMSEYPPGFRVEGTRDKEVYELVEESLTISQNRLQIFQNTIASTSISIRPWIQNNDYPSIQTPEMVRKQMDAVYISNVRSWLMFDAGSTYNSAVFKAVEQ